MNMELKVKFVGRKNFELLEDFDYEFEVDPRLLKFTSNEGNKTFITIPKGFNTDFGSIPQLFQSFVSPIGSPTKAYVLHDYLLSLYECGKISKRKICDKAFRSALKTEGVGMVRRSFMYLCVRIWSAFKEITGKFAFKTSSE